MHALGGPKDSCGVYRESEVHRVRISRPICSFSQIAQHAEVKVLESALEVASCHQHPISCIFSSKEYVVNGFNEWMHQWKTRGWRKADASVLEHSDIWRNISKLKGTVFRCRFVRRCQLLCTEV
jgi:ribonuclease HI